MPEGLAEFFVRCMSPENGLVVDPFAGSDTTIAVGRGLGRRAFGFKLHEDYAAEALQRIALDLADDVPGEIAGWTALAAHGDN